MLTDKLTQDIAATRMLGAVDPAMPNDALVDPLAQQQMEQEAAQMALAAVQADEAAAAAPVAAPDVAAPVAPPVATQGMTQMSESVSVPVVTSKYADSKGLIGDAGRAMEAGVNDLGVLASEADAVYAQQQDAIAGKAAVEADAAKRDAALMEEYEADKDESYNQAVNKITTADEDIRRLSEREPDPGRFWETRTDGQKALYFLTMALQAFSDPTKSPAISDTLMKFVDRDIKMQEDRMGREVDAAQGRARSVRELIAMGSDKEEAIYKARQSRLAALYKMQMAPVNASMETAQAKEGRMKMSQAILGEMQNLRQGFFDNKLKASEQSLAQAKFAYQKKQDTAAAQAAADAAQQQGIEGVYVENLVAGGAGNDGKIVVPNPVIKTAGADISKLAQEHAAATGLLTEGRQIIADQVAAGAKSPFTTPEWIQWARRAGPTLSNMQGVKGAQSDRDVRDAGAGLGKELVSANGIISLDTWANAKTDWRSVDKALSAMDVGAGRVYSAGIKALSDPRQSSGLKMQTSDELLRGRMETRRQEREAVKQGQVSSMADLGMEKQGAEVIGKFIPTMSGKSSAELTTSEALPQLRAPKVRSSLRETAYTALDAVQQAKSQAKTPAEKQHLARQEVRLKSTIWVTENTPEGESADKYMDVLKKRAESARKIESSRGKDGSNPSPLGFSSSPESAKAAIAAYEEYKDKYDTASGKRK